jgi:transposase
MRKLLNNDTKAKIIALYQSGKGSDTVAKQFDIHPNTVLKLLKKAGLASRPIKRKISSNDEQVISKLYQDGLSMETISKKFAVNAVTIFNYLKKNDIKSRTAEECHRKYTINENYFDNIDTQEKAYILGFLYADGGNVQKSNFTSIHLNIKDIDILYKISDKIYCENSQDRVNIYERIKKDKKFTHCNLNINSKYICNQLAKLGCGPRKSFTLTFPEWLIDSDLQRHFIRGYYDGDGGLHLTNVKGRSVAAKIIGTNQFINKISEIVIDKTNINIYTEFFKNNLCRSYVSGNRQVRAFLDWLYKDATIYLDRKYQLYQDFLLKHNNFSFK